MFFVWFWTLTQWNFVACCCNIDPLKLENFRLDVDSLIGKYFDNKNNKQVEQLAETNIYAKPFEWMYCFWTGLGI